MVAAVVAAAVVPSVSSATAALSVRYASGPRVVCAGRRDGDAVDAASDDAPQPIFGCGVEWRVEYRRARWRVATGAESAVGVQQTAEWRVQYECNGQQRRSSEQVAAVRRSGVEPSPENCSGGEGRRRAEWESAHRPQRQGQCQ